MQDQRISTRREARLQGRKRYFTARPCVRGHLSERYVSDGSCTECGKIHCRKSKQRRRDSGLLVNVYRAKHRAKAKGWDFNLPVDLSCPDLCECCGRKLDNFSIKNTDSSPSLDRFDSSRGYTMDNVRVICVRCNLIKNNASADELRCIASWIDKVSLEMQL